MQNPPPGFHSITPYLTVDDPAAALDFYARAFGATETFRMEVPGADGAPRIMHAEFKIGDSILMLSGEWPEHDMLGPAKRGGASVSLMIYVDDADATFAQAVAAGGEARRPVEDQFYGDRSGAVGDPFGHAWMISTHVRDVGEEEMRAAMAAMAG